MRVVGGWVRGTASLEAAACFHAVLQGSEGGRMKGGMVQGSAGSASRCGAQQGSGGKCGIWVGRCGSCVTNASHPLTLNQT